jgi:hypothetical protein
MRSPVPGLLRRLLGGAVALLLGLGPAIALPHPASAATRSAEALAPTGSGLAAAPARPGLAAFPSSAAGGCPVGGVEVDLAGSGDTAVVSGHGGSACGAGSGSRSAGGGPRAFSTYEIACSTDHTRAAEGLCSNTPCDGGLFFAFRTLHRPDGATEPAGWSCVSLERARVAPALTAADVFAVVRRVRLPAGSIHITPGGRGLANVPSRLWLVGDAQPPVDLRLAGSTVHAEFQPVRYRWTVAAGARGAAGGDATWTVPARPNPSGRDGQAAMTFPSRGDFVVTVVTTWSASAFLDGRFVGQIDDLASTARIRYAVAELRTALSG